MIYYSVHLFAQIHNFFAIKIYMRCILLEYYSRINKSRTSFGFALRNYFLSIDDVNKYRPLELNYDQLRVSFQKGCYRGQEVVARMKYLGVNRRIFSTVITKNNYDFEKEFKVIGSKINLNNYFIFNSIIKRESIERLNATDGVVTII